MDILLAILFGIAGGVLGGLVGVGGGILFVPALVIFLDEPQVRAEATSLLAIVIVAIAGTWRQRTYGNVGSGGRQRGLGAHARGRLRGPGAGGRRPARDQSEPRSRAPLTDASRALIR